MAAPGGWQGRTWPPPRGRRHRSEPDTAMPTEYGDSDDPPGYAPHRRSIPGWTANGAIPTDIDRADRPR